MTEREAYPIYIMDERISSPGAALILPGLDPNSCFWQIEMGNPDRNKATLTSRFKSHQFFRRPLALCNALRTFQLAMNFIASPVKLQFALIYFDDIIVVSRSAEEHIQHNPNVFLLLYRAGVTLNLTECKHFTEKSNNWDM